MQHPATAGSVEPAMGEGYLSLLKRRLIFTVQSP